MKTKKVRAKSISIMLDVNEVKKLTEIGKKIGLKTYSSIFRYLLTTAEG